MFWLVGSGIFLSEVENFTDCGAKGEMGSH